MLDQRGRSLVLLSASPGCSLLSYDRALWALRTWSDSCDLHCTSEGDQR